MSQAEGVQLTGEEMHDLLTEIDTSYNGRVELSDYFQVNLNTMYKDKHHQHSTLNTQHNNNWRPPSRRTGSLGRGGTALYRADNAPCSLSLINGNIRNCVCGRQHQLKCLRV